MAHSIQKKIFLSRRPLRHLSQGPLQTPLPGWAIVQIISEEQSALPQRCHFLWP